MGFSLLGGSSAKSNTSSQNAGLSEIDGPASVLNASLKAGKNSNVSIQTLDGGAVLGGLDVARKSLDIVDAVNSRSTAALSAQVGQAYQLANQARQSETSGAINNVLKYGAVVLGLAVLAWAAVRAKG